MIINTGGHTDTVNYYSEWLLNRFNEGVVLTRNPYYPRTVLRYELTPDDVVKQGVQQTFLTGERTLF